MEENDKNKIKENITDQFIFHYYMHIKYANVLNGWQFFISGKQWDPQHDRYEFYRQYW